MIKEDTKQLRANKKLARKLKMPAGTQVTSLSARWYKRGGYLGAKVIERVLTVAEKCGFKKEPLRHFNSPDGSVVGSSDGLFNKAGDKLTTVRSYGVTKHDNWFSITVEFHQPVKAPA